MSRSERKCPDCGGTTFVEDHAQGDIVCKGCGLVAEAHIIDERSEWRTFSDKDKESTDPNRVGGPNNPLLDGGGLATIIAKGQGEGSSALNRLQARSVNPDKALMNAFRQIGDLSEKLSLQGGTAKQLACELYKQSSESGKLRGRSTAAICAACMYLACRQNNTPRSFKEITAVLPDVRKKDISACFKEVLLYTKNTNHRVDTTPQHPADYMTRFMTSLKLHRNVANACRDMALSAKPKNETADSVLKAWDSRSPLSVAAAILYIVTMIADPVPMQQVVLVTDVTEATIKAVYRDLYPHLAQLLPPNFNSPAQIAKLPVPDIRGGGRG